MKNLRRILDFYSLLKSNKKIFFIDIEGTLFSENEFYNYIFKKTNKNIFNDLVKDFNK